VKKLVKHIRLLATFLTLLIVFAIGGKSIHVFYSDCDHHSHLLAHESDDHEHQQELTDLEESVCEWCKFTLQTPTLFDSPTIDTISLIVVDTRNHLILQQHAHQEYYLSNQLRGPPSLG